MNLKVQLIALVISTTVFAQVHTSSLKSAMKEMSTVLKAVTAQAADATKNKSSADLAGQFVRAAEEAKTFFPSSANDQASKEKYTEMMDTVIVSGKELQVAFQSNDNTKASVLLNQLVQDKKEGHNQFKQ